MSLENLKTDSKSNWGGFREGSGRKPKLQYEMRELFNTFVDEEWENVMKVLKYQILRGDKEVMKWVIEQRIGRTPQMVGLSSGGSLTVESVSSDTKIDIDEIANRVSKELKKIKTGN